MARLRNSRCSYRSKVVAYCVYMSATLFACAFVYFDTRHRKSEPETVKTISTKRQGYRSKNLSRHHEDSIDIINPLTNHSLTVRLSLSPDEQRLIASQNWSLSNLGIPLPGTGREPESHDYTSRRRRMNLDLLGMKNLTFDGHYKNPCWRDIHSSMNCLPYFFLIGAPKCGTTDLYRRLAQHPDIVQGMYKEPHWLTRLRTGPVKSQGLQKDPSAFTVYLSYFQKLSLKMYNRSNADKITGDCSASTLWDNDIWRRLPRNDNPLEPVYTNADYVYKLNKNSKILVLLRDPVQRLYSDYLYFENTTQFKSPAIFHGHVVQSVRVFTACMVVFSVRSCVYNAELRKMLKVRLEIGIYYIHLTEWYRRFPAEQILILNSEKYAKHTRVYMEKVFNFLKLERLNDTVMEKIADQSRANTRSDMNKNIGGMWPETSQILRDFYRPFNARLYKLMKDKNKIRAS